MYDSDSSLKHPPKPIFTFRVGLTGHCSDQLSEDAEKLITAAAAKANNMFADIAEAIRQQAECELSGVASVRAVTMLGRWR